MASNVNDASEHRWRFADIADEPRRIFSPIQGYENTPIVTLDEAVIPLMKQIPDVQEQASIAKQECKMPPADGLTIDESASIRLYTMEWKTRDKSLCYILNETLLSGNRELLKNWFHYMKLFITSLGKIPSTPRLLYRGKKRDLSVEHPAGQSAIWWAFSSCTTSVESLEKGSFFGKTGVRTLFKIRCYSGKDISRHSIYPNETEVLLIAATQFRIDSCRHASEELHIVKLTEIEPKFPLIVKDPVAPVDLTRISWEDGEISTTTLQPPARNSAVKIDLIDHNLELERLIARCRLRSNVNLDNQRLTDQDMETVAGQAILNKQCVKLSLQNNKITVRGIETLMKDLHDNTTLEELDLSNNELSGNDLVPLKQELSDNRPVNARQCMCCRFGKPKTLDFAPIKILILGNNNIGDDGAGYLADILKVKRTLTHLDLNTNKISDRGVQLLANALSNPQANLQKLYLQNNILITNSSVDYFVNMFETNRSLKVLWLIKCNLANDGRKRLREAAPSEREFYLNVEMFD